MANLFAGAAAPLDADGLNQVTSSLGIGAAELWSVLTVETAGCGFNSQRQPAILFERHIFSRETGGRYDRDYPDISNPTPGGYGPPSTQYARLESAVALDRAAALDSASWGIGQVMGFNAVRAGFDDAEDMVNVMVKSETDQLLAMSKFLESGSLVAPLRKRDWVTFARGYNGANYAINQYDTRLASAYAKYAAGPMSDLLVRSAQMLLTYLGYNPGAIDGLEGGRTDAAIAAFLRDRKLPSPPAINEDLIAALDDALQQADSEGN